MNRSFLVLSPPPSLPVILWVHLYVSLLILFLLLLLLMIQKQLTYAFESLLGVTSLLRPFFIPCYLLIDPGYKHTHNFLRNYINQEVVIRIKRPGRSIDQSFHILFMMFGLRKDWGIFSRLFMNGLWPLHQP